MTDFFITYKSLFILLHALGAAGALGAVFVTDVLFVHFLKDRVLTSKEFDTLKTISLFVWAMIIFLLITGIGLYLSAPDAYLVKSKFITKIIIFCVIVANGTLLHLYITPSLKNMSFVNDHTVKHIAFIKRLAFASGGVSFVSWLTVFILGSVRAIPYAVTQALWLYIILIIITIVGSQLYLARASK